MIPLSASTVPSDHRKSIASFLHRLLNHSSIYLILLGLTAAGFLLSPKFAAGKNLLNVLQNITLLGIVSIGTAFITYSRHYVDLSIPAIMAFSGLAAISAQPWGVAASMIFGFTAGLSVGFLNGYIIGYWRVNPIIWTLAMQYMLDGFLRWAYRGRQIYPDRDIPAGAFFLNLSQTQFGGFLPLPTLILFLLTVLGQWLIKRTRFGVQVQLIGASYEVARLSGVPVHRTVMWTFLLSAFTTTIAGLLLTSMNRQGTFDTGMGYEFNAVTAVVLGGVNLSGGQGSILGAIGGVLVIGILLNLMTLAGLDSFSQMVVKGLVFIVVVGISSWLAKNSGRADV